MKLLSISGILPIPDLIKENDIIFQIYDHYTKEFPDTEIQFIRTIAYSNFLLAQIKEKWNRYYQAIQKGEYTDRGYHITVFPHFIFNAKEDLYSFLTKSLYYQNLFKVQKFDDFDLIHAQRIFPEGYLAYKISQKFSIPYVLTVRKETHYFNGSYAEKQAKKILEHASHITTLTKMSFSYFDNKYPAKTHLIPHGIANRFFAEHGGSGKGPVEILTIARLLAYKRIEVVVKALSKLKDKYDFRYTIIGEGPRKEIIRQCIEEYNMQDRVNMVSRVPHEEIPNIYAGSDIFVLASYPETFGRVYFEAMASGLPTICCRNSGVDGLFVNGESGFSVDHEDPEELVNVLEKLIQDETFRQKMGKAGQQVVREYTWPRIVQKYHAVYQRSITSRQGVKPDV